MIIAFSVAVYLALGLAIAIWLAGEKRLPNGIAVRAAAVFFWPAYLPLCLAPTPASDSALEGLRQQIDRLPIDPARKSEYKRAVDRLSSTVDLRQRELVRLSGAEDRLGRLGVVDSELDRVRFAKRTIEQDIARAREGMLKLAVRLELIDVSGSRGTIEEELASLEEEIGGLLDARDQVFRGI